VKFSTALLASLVMIKAPDLVLPKTICDYSLCMTLMRDIVEVCFRES